MRVVITGGGGFIGRRLALRFLKKGHLGDGQGGKRAIDALTLFDAQAPRGAIPDDPRLTVVVGDVSDAARVREAISPDTGAVFHLAAVLSAGAKEDFDMRPNCRPTPGATTAPWRCRGSP